MNNITPIYRQYAKYINLYIVFTHSQLPMFLLKEQKQTGPIQYDQNHLDIKITHGRTQLQEIKIVHSWKDPNIKYRLPKLRCQWFNKTDTSMQQIKGIQQEFYQPSVLDVGTQIYLQIVPDAKDLDYTGMPITKLIGPLQLAAETQEQAIQLLEAGKSTFFIQFKELSLAKLEEDDLDAGEGKVALKECLLKIVNNKMLIHGKKIHSTKSEVLLQIEIKNDYPQLQLDRTCGKFLNILFSPSQYAIIVLQNNKVRDVLFLLVKMIAQKSHKKQEDVIVQPLQNIENIKKIQILQDQKQNVKIQQQQQQQKKAQQTPLSPQTIEKDVGYQSIIPAQFKNKLLKLQEQIFKKSKQIEDYKIKTIDLTKLNALLQKQKSSYKKQISEYESKLSDLTQLKEKQRQEMCYLRNQCRLKQQNCELLKKQLHQLSIKFKQINKKYELTEQQRKQYAKYSKMGIKEALNLLLIKDKQIQQFSLKQSYKQNEQDQRLQQNVELKSQLEHYESLNKNLTKKLQSIQQAQLLAKQKASYSKQQQNNQLIFQISRLKQQISLKLNQIQSLNKEKDSLKGQIKQLIEQNLVLRTKDKSSKNQLKLEVVELKKLVNRFAETITQKDQQISNLRTANKTLNKAILQIKK